jgi:hypothetical protein
LALVFFFRSNADFETFRPVLQNGTRMSFSMHNKVSFLRLFLAPDIWSLSFSFRSHAALETLRKLLAHGSRMSYSMNNKSVLNWIYFLPLISGYLPFSFDPLPPLKRWGRYWQVGPTSSMNNKSFLWWIYFWPLLIPCRLGIVEDAAASWVPHVSLSER